VSNAALDLLLSKLRPPVRARAVAWLSACNDLYLPIQYPQFEARITVTGRTEGEQAAAVAAGLSNVKLGWHQFGCAWDYGIFRKDSGQYITDGSFPAYAVCGQASVPLGCHYPIYLGPNQTKPDVDHVEYHPGFTLQQMVAAVAAGEDLLA
jgi:hypothetical protein